MQDLLPDPHQELADGPTLDDLRGSGLLDSFAYHRAVLKLRSPAEWRGWLDQFLLVVGSALLLSGVLFFFAYNWEAMSRWSRFGLIEAVLLASTLGAVAKGLDTHAGKALLTASGVLLGIFLAVFGQTYQTGADAWTFFAGWTALMGPWVLLSNAAPLWMLWLVLGNLTLGTWLVQFAAPADWINPGFHPLLLAILNLTALFGRERAVSQGKDWLAASWTRWIPLASSLALLTWPATLWSASAMHDPGRYFFPAKGLAGPDSVLALALVGAAAWAYYRHRVRDLVAVNFLALSLGIFVYCNSLALLRKLGLGHRLAGFTSWMFLAAAITVGIGWAVTTGMRGIAEQIRSEKEEQA